MCLQNLVLAGAAGAEVLATVFAVFGKDMLGVLQVQQRPALRGAAQYHMAATSAVATVGTGFGVVLHPQQMGAAGASFARTDEYFNVVYKVGCHSFML